MQGERKGCIDGKLGQSGKPLPCHQTKLSAVCNVCQVLLIVLYVTLMPLLSFFQPLTHVCAKNLATPVSQEAGNRPVLLGLALKDSSIEGVKLMRDLIKSCQVW